MLQVISPRGEQAGLIAHYAWYFTMAYCLAAGAPGPVTAALQALAFVVLSNVFTVSGSCVDGNGW